MEMLTKYKERILTMVDDTVFKTMMQNCHKYTSLKLFCEVSLKFRELNPV